MINRKICPFLSIVSDAERCVHDECAWWDDEAQVCAVLSGSLALRYISQNIDSFLEEVQHVSRDDQPLL